MAWISAFLQVLYIERYAYKLIQYLYVLFTYFFNEDKISTLS